MLALGEHAAFVVARLIAVPLAVAHRGKAQGAGGLGRGVGAFHGCFMFRLLVLVCAKVHILSDLAKKKGRKMPKRLQTF